MSNTTDKWLGDGNPFSESFPPCGLNERQIATLVGFSQLHVVGLGVSPAIRKLSESGIVEITVRWATTMDSHGSAGKLWVKEDGTYIAGAVWEGARHDAPGPIKVYRWHPRQDRRSFTEHAEMILFERSEGHKGAYELTRQYIKHYYVNEENTA